MAYLLEDIPYQSVSSKHETNKIRHKVSHFPGAWSTHSIATDRCILLRC